MATPKLKRRAEVTAQLRFHRLLVLIAAPVKAFFHLVNWLIYKTSPNETYFDAKDFPWTAAVEAAYPQIREECVRAIADLNRVPNINDVAEGAAKLAEGTAWKTYGMLLYGVRAETHIAQCPNTWAAVQHIPGLTMCLFSIIGPRAHLPKHRAFFGGILRYHMGVIVPTVPGCRIAVDDVERPWEEGKSMIFDETHPHEVWNDTDQLRVVLFCDFIRPMPAPLRWFTRFFYWMMRQTTYPHDAVRNAQRPTLEAQRSAETHGDGPCPA